MQQNAITICELYKISCRFARGVASNDVVQISATLPMPCLNYTRNVISVVRNKTQINAYLYFTFFH